MTGAFGGSVGPLDGRLDHWVRGVAARISSWGRPTATGLALASVRGEAADRALDARHLVLRELAEVFTREGEAAEEITEAKNRLARIASDGLASMRRDVDARASRSWRAPLALLDRRWRETDTVELIDRVEFDQQKRVQLMAHLDEMNVTLGAYAAFFDVLRPFLRSDRPTRVLDLAAGHGGFLLEVARLAREEGLALELVASDIAQEYLAIGEVNAARRGLPVRFVVQDALDTTNLEPGAYDVIVCTQSLHHFPPGLVSVLVHEALRIASSAVVLIDGARSKTNAALIPMLGVLRYRDLPFAHDSWVSLRKFFSPEELGLLARFGATASPGAPRGVTSRFLPPGHIATVVSA